jgi:hypothetical protein
LNYLFNYFYSTGAQSISNGSNVTHANLVRSHVTTIGISRKFSRSLSGTISSGAMYLVGDSMYSGTGVRYQPGIKPVVIGNIIYSPSFDPRTYFSMQASQSLSNGAGLGATALVLSGSVSIGRRFTKYITGSAIGSYARNQYLSDLDSANRTTVTNGFYAIAKLAINFTEKLNFFADYQHFQQLSTGFAGVIPGQMTGNIFTIGLGYSFPWFFK